MSAAVDNAVAPGRFETGPVRRRRGREGSGRTRARVPICGTEDTGDSFRVRRGNAVWTSGVSPPPIGVGNVTDKSSDEIAEIEATQAALKESIQATKDLADKAEHLLQRHKRNMERDAESASQAA